MLNSDIAKILLDKDWDCCIKNNKGYDICAIAKAGPEGEKKEEFLDVKNQLYPLI